MPDALVDAWLLRRFPGRTLDELDAMDWPRLLRAIEADRIEQAEHRRLAFLAGDLAADDLTDDEWNIINRNDEILGATDGDGQQKP